MKITHLLSVAVLTGASFSAVASADTIDVVTGGTATIAITADLFSNGLGTNLGLNADGVPERSATIRATSLDDRNVPTGFGSQVIPGGELLSLRTGDIRLFPLDSAGNEIESFQQVLIFPQFGPAPDGVPDDIRRVNFVATGNPSEYRDVETGTLHILTPEQEALLSTANLRTCCAHGLSGLTVDTSSLILDGIIDNQTFRDANNDGINDNDEFHLFDLVPTANEDIFDLALTLELAQFLNFGFTEFGFADPTEFNNNWVNFQNGTGFLSFQGGDIIGTITLAVDTATVTSPVPVPAALPLLLTGVGLMGAARYRRQKKAA